MKLYQKVKLVEVIREEDGKVLIAEADGHNEPNHLRQPYWLPREKFDKLYEEVTTMTFSSALVALKSGCRVERKGWNGKGIFVKMQVPDEDSKMSEPYLYIDTSGLQTDNDMAPKCRVPWTPSQTDLLASDWIIVWEMR